MNPTLTVLAAGLGSRFGGPKQIESIGPNGEFIIDYSIYDAVKAGFKKAVFVIRKDMEHVFKDYIKRFDGIIDTELVYQDLFNLPEPFSTHQKRKKPWGTGHAILACKDNIQEPFCVINADDFYGQNSYRMIAELMREVWNSNPSEPNFEHQAHFCLVGYELRNTLSDHGTVSRGICEVDGNGYLARVVERTKVKKNGVDATYLSSNNNWVTIKGGELVSTNLWGFTPNIFYDLMELFMEFLNEHSLDEKAEFFIPSAIDQLIQRNRAKVTVLRSDEQWVGVTHRKDKSRVKDQINKRISLGDYPKTLWE